MVENPSGFNDCGNIVYTLNHGMCCAGSAGSLHLQRPLGKDEQLSFQVRVLRHENSNECATQSDPSFWALSFGHG